MGSKFWPKGGVPGILHHYTETLVAYEYTSANARKPHSLLFIGGTGDGLATTSYMADVAAALQPTQWSLFFLTLSSAYSQWGMGHLDRDTNEIAQCAKYIMDYKSSQYTGSKFALMGHSTGSQAVLHYLHRPNPHPTLPRFDPDLEKVIRPVVDGAIMQAPVSDRQAVQWVLKEGFNGRTASELQETYDRCFAVARGAASRDQSVDTLLPLAMTSQIWGRGTPITCRRWLSMVSPDSPESPSEDDLFSSDLSDEQLSTTFGMVDAQGLLRNKLVILFSGADQSVPDWVDKENLLRRWKNATNHGGKKQIWDDEHSAIVPGASHALSNDDQAEPRKFLVKRVLGYLQALEQV